MSFEVPDIDLGDISREIATNNSDDNSGTKKYVATAREKGFIEVRLLPWAKGDEQLYVRNQYHKLLVNGKEWNVHTRRTWDHEGKKWVGTCPINGYYNHCWTESKKCKAQGDEQGRKRWEAKAREIKPIQRFYFNVIVLRDADGKDLSAEGPKILSVGKMLRDFILTSVQGDEVAGVEPLGKVWHLAHGRNLRIVTSVKPGDDGRSYPSYEKSKFLEPSPATKNVEQAKEWMVNLHDLTLECKPRDEEETKRLLKIHLGVISAERADGFDPSEYESSNDADAVGAVRKPAAEKPDTTGLDDDDDVNATVTKEAVKETPKQAAKSATKAPAKTSPTADEDELPADADFLKELEDLVI